MALFLLGYKDASCDLNNPDELIELTPESKLSTADLVQWCIIDAINLDRAKNLYHATYAKELLKETYSQNRIKAMVLIKAKARQIAISTINSINSATFTPEEKLLLETELKYYRQGMLETVIEELEKKV